MAVSTQLNITQESYDPTTNTSTVTVEVVANYNAGSWNNTGNADGQLVINGNTYDFTGNFNASQAQSGSEVMYTQTIVVDHNVTNNVDCSVTYNSGVSSGTVGSSTSITLNGDPSSGDDDDNVQHTKYDYVIKYDINKYCVVKYGASVENPELEAIFGVKELKGTGKYSYESIYQWDSMSFEFLYSKDYNLEVVFINNGNEVAPEILSSGIARYRYSPGTTNMTVRAIPKITEYSAYIDTEIVDYTSYVNNCIFDGHASVEYDWYNNDCDPPSYSTSGEKLMGHTNLRKPYRAVYFLKFTTPDFIGNLENIRFVMPISSLYDKFSKQLHSGYLLSTSDINYKIYAENLINDTAFTDENLIARGVFIMPIEGPKEIVLNISNIVLKRNITYYLMLYCATTGDYDQESISVPTITINSIGEPVVGTHIEQNRYECYIDNGTDWEKCTLHIDDATS